MKQKTETINNLYQKNQEAKMSNTSSELNI